MDPSHHPKSRRNPPMSKSGILPELDRRCGERRKLKVTSFIYGNWLARRRYARREKDQQGYYVDWYESHLLCLIVGVLLLSCADALMTLVLLEMGGRELNGFMAMLIHIDVQLFAALKMAFTGAGLVFLVIHQHFQIFRRVRVNFVLRAVLLLYLLLVGYEFMLLQPRHTPAPAILIVLMGIVLSIMGLYLDRKRAQIMASAHVD